LFIYVTFVVRTTAWLTVLYRKQTTVFDIDTGVRAWNRLNTSCFTASPKWVYHDHNRTL